VRDISEWRHVLRATGLPVNTVTRHRDDPSTIVVYLDPNAGLSVEQKAVATIQNIEGVIAAHPSRLTPTIIHVWLR
jgi:hypothetical protein